MDFLPTIQVTILLTDHLAIRLLMAIRLPDVYDNWMPTVYRFSNENKFKIDVKTIRFTQMLNI